MVLYPQKSTVILKDSSHRILDNVLEYTVQGVKYGLGSLSMYEHKVDEIDFNNLDLEPRYDNDLWAKILNANNLIIIGYENNAKNLSHVLKRFFDTHVLLNSPKTSIFLYTTEQCHNDICQCSHCSCQCKDSIRVWSERNNVDVKSETRWNYHCSDSDITLVYFRDMASIITEYVCK